MTQFIIRAAQSAFNQAGYSRDETYKQAQMVAGYMMAHLDECKATYRTDDELELAYKLARAMIAEALPS